MVEPPPSAAMQPPASPAPAGKPQQPTEFPPAVAKTIDWLERRFGTWYKHNPPPMPDRFTRREFGFMLWPTRPGPPPFVRHRAFPMADRFRHYLQTAGPHSCYYSTAYYERPGEMKMADKKWLAAELIFDLDADHLADVEKANALAKEGKGAPIPLDEQLRQVKAKFKTLLDEFLFGDFGLGPDDVWITFSGGRGYHAHVVEGRLMQLGSKERREVVDYITGKLPAALGSEEPDVEVLFEKKATGAERFGKHVSATYTYEMAPIDAPGWPGRMTRAIHQQLQENVFTQDPKVAKKWIASIDGIGTKTADKFLERLARFHDGRDFTVEQLLAMGRISHKQDPLYRIAVATATQFGLPMAKGETDEPVTADVKRLIRLPGSLHGKSGLKVVTLRRDDLDDFDPLRDAVAFGSDPVKIVPRSDAEMTLAGQRVAVKKGEATDVPEHHAVFWLARQGGTIVA